MSRLKARRMRHSGTKDKFITVCMWVATAMLILVGLWAQNNWIITRPYIYSDLDMPKAFVGYKIVHVADLCNSTNSVYRQVNKLNPDIIVLSGGYTDDNGNANRSINEINRLANIAPVYYVYSQNDETDVLAGVNATDMTNKVIDLEAGVQDPESFIKELYGNAIINSANSERETWQAAQNNENATDEEKDLNTYENLAYVEYIKEALQKTEHTKIGLLGLSRNTGDKGKYEALQQAYDLLQQTEAKYTIGLIGNARTIPEVSKSRLNIAFTGGTYGTNLLSDIYRKGLHGIGGVQSFFCGGIGTKGGINRIFNFPEIQCITLSDGTISDDTPLEDFIEKFIPNVGTIFDNDGGFQTYTYNYGAYNANEEK